MNIASAANRYDNFLAVREAAARRMAATPSTSANSRIPGLTPTPSTMDHGVATQVTLAPAKGQHVDFLA